MNYITITDFLLSKSASPSIIAKGYFNKIPAYFKIFYNGDDETIKTKSTKALLYESNVYKHISTFEDIDKQFFIKLLSTMDTTINELVLNKYIKDGNNEVLQQRMKQLKIDIYSKVHIIITEDTDSINLYTFIDLFSDDKFNKNNFNNLLNILNQVFHLVLRGILILNNIFKIQHNDLHFSNILIKTQDTYYKFHQDSKQTHKSNYKISIFDFDRSYQFDKNNEILDDMCKIGYGCNSLSYKDIFGFVQDICYLLIQYDDDKKHPKYFWLSKYLTSLLSELIPDDDIRIYLYSNAKKNLKKNLNINSYCLHEEDSEIIYGMPCSDVKKQDELSSWLGDVYENFNKFIYKTIKITEDKKMSYFEKYIKYKNKYLLLKKLNIEQKK